MEQRDWTEWEAPQGERGRETKREREREGESATPASLSLPLPRAREGLAWLRELAAKQIAPPFFERRGTCIGKGGGGSRVRFFCGKIRRKFNHALSGRARAVRSAASITGALCKDTFHGRINAEMPIPLCPSFSRALLRHLMAHAKSDYYSAWLRKCHALRHLKNISRGFLSRTCVTDDTCTIGSLRIDDRLACDDSRVDSIGFPLAMDRQRRHRASAICGFRKLLVQFCRHERKREDGNEEV